MVAPGRYQNYWHYLVKEEKCTLFNNLVAMVWLAIYYCGRTNVVFLSEKQNYKDYIETLNSELLPVAGDIEGGKLDFPIMHIINNI